MTELLTPPVSLRALDPPGAVIECSTRTLDVSVVLPCLNEESSVGLCVSEAWGAIEAAGWFGEVVVVDNGSSDNSAAVARAAGARVVHESTPGYGAALLCGIRAAVGEVIVMADADCTYPLDRLAELVRPVRNGEAAMTIGARLQGTDRATMPFLHRFVGTPVLTWLVREGTGATSLSDSQSGFRAFRRDVVATLGLQATGMEFASEMLIRAAQADLCVEELPLGYRARVGESKLDTWRDGMRHLRLIIRMSPHILLWAPGWIALVVGLATYAMTLVGGTGPSVGSLTWQPVFFGTILLVGGLLALMSGAFLARYSPSASSTTKARFGWVSDRRTALRLQRAGDGLALVGVAADAVLFALWVQHSPVASIEKLHLASMAQGLLLCGLLLAMAMRIYRLILSARSASHVPELVVPAA
jgi:hypothetical protein